jgi:hypothetical protein
LLKYSPDMASMIQDEFPEEDFNFLKELATKKESGITSKAILEFLKAQDIARISPISELPFELALIEISQ